MYETITCPVHISLSKQLKITFHSKQSIITFLRFYAIFSAYATKNRAVFPALTILRTSTVRIYTLWQNSSIVCLAVEKKLRVAEVVLFPSTPPHLANGRPNTESVHKLCERNSSERAILPSVDVLYVS